MEDARKIALVAVRKVACLAEDHKTVVVDSRTWVCQGDPQFRAPRNSGAVVVSPCMIVDGAFCGVLVNLMMMWRNLRKELSNDEFWTVFLTTQMTVIVTFSLPTWIFFLKTEIWIETEIVIVNVIVI